MGQYYKAILRTDGGDERVFAPGASAYMAYKGWDADELYAFFDVHVSDNGDGTQTWKPYPDEYHMFSNGSKLSENGYPEASFVEGIVNELRNRPARVAWVGDYANEEEDFTGIDGYGEDTYNTLWGPDEGQVADPVAFRIAPERGDSLRGYLVNRTKGVFLDLADTATDAALSMHPLPVLTAIGNGRGGGDYFGPNMDAVGSWAMDVLEVIDAEPAGFERLGRDDTRFVLGECERTTQA